MAKLTPAQIKKMEEQTPRCWSLDTSTLLHTGRKELVRYILLRGELFLQCRLSYDAVPDGSKHVSLSLYQVKRIVNNGTRFWEWESSYFNRHIRLSAERTRNYKKLCELAPTADEIITGILPELLNS